MSRALASKTKDVCDVWEKRASTFGPWEVMTQQAADAMYLFLKLDSATSILETGCGRGGGTTKILPKLPPGASAVITDIGPSMVSITKDIVTKLNCANIHVDVREVNAMDLSDFPSGQFDRYLSNLCLHLVPDADVMLREARRVLSPGGLAGFTIFGREAHNVVFTEQDMAMVESKLAPGPPDRSSAFLIGKDWPTLHTRLQAAGFTSCRYWPVQCQMEVWSADTIVQTILATNPNIKTLVEGASSELRQAFVSNLTQRYAAILDTGRPIGLECYVIVAKAE